MPIKWGNSSLKISDTLQSSFVSRQDKKETKLLQRDSTRSTLATFP